MTRPLCVMLVAAEASGDDRGAGLARALCAGGVSCLFVVVACPGREGEPDPDPDRCGQPMNRIPSGHGVQCGM